jgi:hypothetical protein
VPFEKIRWSLAGAFGSSQSRRRCRATSTASRSAADMLDVGCPEPTLVLERIESTRNWAASSATVSRPGSDVGMLVMLVLDIAQPASTVAARRLRRGGPGSSLIADATIPIATAIANPSSVTRGLTPSANATPAPTIGTDKPAKAAR